MKLQYRKPCDNSLAQYDPETEGHFIVALIGQAYPWIGPLPSNRRVELAYGSVGNPRRTMIEAQRDLCRIYARWGEYCGRAFAIYKCPCALAERAAFVSLTCEPDGSVLKQAASVNWENASAWKIEQYHKGEGVFAERTSA